MSFIFMSYKTSFQVNNFQIKSYIKIVLPNKDKLAQSIKWRLDVYESIPIASYNYKIETDNVISSFEF